MIYNRNVSRNKIESRRKETFVVLRIKKAEMDQLEFINNLSFRDTLWTC